jgi:hypothetical protein
MSIIEIGEQIIRGSLIVMNRTSWKIEIFSPEITSCYSLSRIYFFLQRIIQWSNYYVIIVPNGPNAIILMSRQGQ